MRLPDMVCGPETLKAKENDSVLDMITKEVEQLKRVSWFAPYTT